MEVITLNKEVFSQKCSELVLKLDLQPELIVGILNGGRYVVDEIKNDFSKTHIELVKLKRKLEWIDYLAKPFILKSFSKDVRDELRKYKAKNTEKSVDKLDLFELSKCKFDLKLDITEKEKVKTILIIDDAIDTGRTMFVVMNNLRKLFPKSEIKTAVISWTMENSIVKPDYYLFKQVLVRFPWSKDYKEQDFE